VLRRAAGDDAIVTHGQQVTLSPSAAALDVDAFEAAYNGRDYAAASDLVLGEFLEGFTIPGASGFEDWVSAERRRWTARGVAALCARAGTLMGQGRLGEAMDAAERALRLDPVSEAGADAMLRVLVLRGERASALDRFQRYAALLQERVGAAPSAPVLALVERIRRERVRPEPAAVVERVQAGRPCPPLIGRARELEALLAVWQTVRSTGAPGVAILIGEQGSGKTRLAEELCARARLDGAAVCGVRAVASDQSASGSGLLGLAAGMVQLGAVAGASPQAVAALSAKVPAWAERFPSVRLDQGAAPLSVPAAMLDVLRAAAGDGAIVLWLDDAHFLDPETLGFLEALPRDAADLPVLLVAGLLPHAARDELDRLRARIGREVEGVAVTVGAFGPEQLRALAAWALPAYGPTELERISRRLALDSAGLPLLAVELLDAVAAGLELGGEGGAWPQPFRTLDHTLPGDLPDSITAAVRVSYRRLSPVAQKALAALAVLGDRVQPGDLALALGHPPAEVLNALDELEWARWVVAEPRGYGFTARVVRDIVGRDLITPGQRRRLQESAGNA
jgi:DNA-binding SARP family transcriptional activator